ncbi:MAG: hypothetical protein ACI4RJ_05955, partial [Alphaproteobacteria bacterium]
IVADEMFSSLPAEQEEVSMAGKFAPKSPYDFTAFKESDITFAVVADKVSFPVCEEVRQRKVDWLEEIRPNGKENTCKKEENNAISFFFNSAFNAQASEFFGACKEDADCGECGTCNGRMCVYDSNKPVKSGDNCVACPVSTVYPRYKATFKSCQQCKDAFFSGSNKENGTCHNCKANVSTVSVTKSECLKCNKNGHNKYWYGTYVDENSLGFCLDCDGTVTKDGTYCEWSCDKGYIAGQSKFECKSCDSVTSYMDRTTRDLCLNCEDHFFSHTVQWCINCAVNHTNQGVLYEDCLNCIQKGYNKFWTEPSNQNWGRCLNCIGTVVGTNSVCDWNCPEGTFGGYGSCSECNPTGSTTHSSRSSCHQCSDRYYSGISELDGRCSGCSDTGDYGNTLKADCLRCNDAGYKRYWTGTYVDENSRGVCSLCNGTVSADGTQCITN